MATPAANTNILFPDQAIVWRSSRSRFNTASTGFCVLDEIENEKDNFFNSVNNGVKVIFWGTTNDVSVSDTDKKLIKLQQWTKEITKL